MNRKWLFSSAVVAALAVALCAADLLQPAPADAQAGKKKTDKQAQDRKASRDVAQERALLRQTARVESSRVEELEKIVSWAATSGLKADAARIYESLSKLDPENKDLTRLKTAIDKAAEPEDKSRIPELQKTLAKKIEAANDTDARKLFALAKRCMAFGLFTRAYDLVNQVATADPDHKEARKILGYAWDSTSKSWITQWELETRKTHFLTEEGWVKKEHKSKWEKGLREYQTKWVSREEEERIRKRNPYNMFSATSEHFHVESNLGRKQAHEFTQELEDFYREFFRFYLGYYDQDEGAKLIFAAAKSKKKHRVLVFPSREVYLTYVKAEKGNNELLIRSAGVYIPSESCAYLYRSSSLEETYSTLYHEITHQLLEETKSYTRSGSGRMWVVEGLATYMETWLKENGQWKPGARVQVPQMQGIAGFLAQASNSGWSIQDYVTLEHKAFHEEANRQFNYAMGCALSHFFLHSQDEVHREAFIRFIKAFYEGKTDGDAVLDFIDVEETLSRAEKNTLLTKQFREHMANLGKKATPPADTDTSDSNKNANKEADK